MPNREKQNGKFDEQLVLSQLLTSNTISYAKFVRFGYPKHISCQRIIDACKAIESKLIKMCVDQVHFCTKVLLSLGFLLDDFKISNGSILFRLNKYHLLEQFLTDAIAAQNISEEKGQTVLSDVPSEKRSVECKPKYFQSILTTINFVLQPSQTLFYRSFTGNVFERIEAFFWRSRWRCVFRAILFLGKRRNKYYLD